jgi:hypothetical protein
MDYAYWAAIAGCSVAAFMIGVGVGGLAVVRLIDAHRAAFLAAGAEQELGA